MTVATVPPPQSADAIAVVTVNWNRWDLTLRCLEALRRSKGAAWRLVIVDNGSTDDSLQHLRGRGDDAILIESPINGGWTGGNNLGVRAALAAGYRHIFVLNNDAFVEPDTLRVLMEVKAEVGDAIIGPIHTDEFGQGLDYLGDTIDPTTGLSIPVSVDAAIPQILPRLIETSAIKGAGIFIDASQFARLGFFDDRFYLNFDETDWCFRARAAGFGLHMVTSAQIRHLGSASIGGRHSPLQTYFMTRNGLLFSEKHCTLKQRWRLFREQFWDATARWSQRNPAMASQSNLKQRLGMIFSRDGHDAAYRLGVIHYLLRRFGDCPPIVRQWNRQAGAQPSIAMPAKAVAAPI